VRRSNASLKRKCTGMHWLHMQGAKDSLVRASRCESGTIFSKGSSDCDTGYMMRLNTDGTVHLEAALNGTASLLSTWASCESLGPSCQQGGGVPRNAGTGAQYIDWALVARGGLRRNTIDLWG
jgi:hypothetical protein